MTYAPSPSTPKQRLIINREGFNLIEIILASSVFVLLVIAVAGAVIYGQQAASTAGSHARAISIAEEGIEATRNIRDAAFGNLSDGAHGLAIVNNQWAFTGASDATDAFTRTVTISSVDDDTKQVTSQVSWKQTPQRTGSVSVVAYMTNWRAETIGDWSNPTESWSFDVSGGQDALKVDTVGDYAYFITDSTSASFVVVDVTDVEHPTVAATVNLQNNPKNIDVEGNYAYVASKDNSQELQVIDITDPEHPVLRGAYNTPGNDDATGVFAIGTTVYLTRQSGSGAEFYIIDASNPNAPQLVGSKDLQTTAYELYVVGNYAYVTATYNTHHLKIIDISTPADPRIVAVYGLPDVSQTSVTITGTTTSLVVGTTTHGSSHTVYVLSTANPIAPTLLGSFQTNSQVNDVALGVSDTRVFVATNNNTQEFQSIDISTPAQPTLVGSYNADDVLNGVVYHPAKDRVFAVSSSNSDEFIILKPQ